MADTAAETSSFARGSLPPNVVFSLAVVYLVWGSTYLGIRVAVETIPPFYMTAVRFFLAGGALYLFLRLRGHVHPTRRQWLGSALLGGLLLIGGNGLVTLALSLSVSLGMAAVIVSTMPLWLALFVRLQGGHIGRLGWVGMLVGLLGIVLLNLDADLRASPVASGLLFVAPLSFALGSFWSPKLPQADGLMASAVQMLAAGVLFALIGLARVRCSRRPRPCVPPWRCSTSPPSARCWPTARTPTC